MVNIWAKVKSNTFHVKLLWFTFGATFVKFGLIFNLTSGHSDGRRLMYKRPRVRIFIIEITRNKFAALGYKV